MKINQSMKTTMSLAAAMGTLALASANAAVMSFGTMTTDGSGDTGWTYDGGGSGAVDGNPDHPGWWVSSFDGGFSHTGTSDGDTLAAGDYTIGFTHAWTTGASAGNFSVEAFAWNGATETSLGAATAVTTASPVKTWTAGSHSFSVAAASPIIGQNLRLKFYNTSDVFYGFDNVAGDFTAVPEPTTTALLGLGGLALILRRRK